MILSVPRYLLLFGYTNGEEEVEEKEEEEEEEKEDVKDINSLRHEHLMDI